MLNRLRKISPTESAVKSLQRGETIALRIRAVREACDLDLREWRDYLQASVGYAASHTSVRNWEQGTKIPAEYVGAVSKATGVSPKWLLHGEGSVQDEPPHRAEVALQHVREALAEYDDRRMDEDA